MLVRIKGGNCIKGADLIRAEETAEREQRHLDPPSPHKKVSDSSTSHSLPRRDEEERPAVTFLLRTSSSKPTEKNLEIFTIETV